MKIAFDARLLGSAPSGVRDVCVGLVQGLFEACGDVDEIRLFGDRASTEWPVTVLSGRGFMHRELPQESRRWGADAILVPRQTRPAISTVPVIPLFHDVGFWREREAYGGNWKMDATSMLALRSRRCLTVSEFTARELYAVGYRGQAEPLPIQAVHRILWSPQESDPYLLVVGVQVPHKNLVRLVEAFTRAETQGFRLLIRAGKGSDSSRLDEAIRGSAKADRIELVGPLGSTEYAKLLSGCWAYVQPSLYEGLCIPVLDMAAAGVPSIVSSSGNTGAVFSRAPDSVSFDPRNVDDMARAISLVLNDSDLRTASSRWGRENIRVTDWREVGRKVFGALA